MFGISRTDILGVVIALCLFAAVAAGLLPRLGHKDGSSRLGKCQGNMRELGLAVQTYCGDFDGVMPSSKLVSGSTRWNEADYEVFAAHRGFLPPKKDQSTYGQIIYDYVKNKPLLFCPSDAETQRSDAPDVKASYVWKAAIDKAWYGEGCTKPHRKISDFAHPADQILLYEREGFHCGEKFLRNGVHINVVYLDGHVRSVSLKGCRVNGSGEPVYFNHDIAVDRPLPADKSPAECIDPSRYGDRF